MSAAHYVIVPASIRHIRPMAKAMRREAAVALDGFGFNPRAGLRRCFVSSFHCRTALIDGRPVAMWGVVGTLLGDSAYVWLVLSDEIRAMPRAILREAKTELDRAAEDYPRIMATILPEDAASVRFAAHLGFVNSDDPSADRVPIGDGYAVRLRYRPEVV